MVKKYQTPTVSVTIDDDELLAAFKALGDNVASALENAGKAGGEVIHKAAESRAPGPNIGMEVKEKDSQHVLVVIGPDKEHWFYQFAETGATAHEIVATKRQRLVFTGREGTIFMKRLQHPGMAAEPFLRPAIDLSGEAAKEAAGSELKRAIEAACRG